MPSAVGSGHAPVSPATTKRNGYETCIRSIRSAMRAFRSPRPSLAVGSSALARIRHLGEAPGGADLADDLVARGLLAHDLDLGHGMAGDDQELPRMAANRFVLRAVERDRLLATPVRALAEEVDLGQPVDALRDAGYVLVDLAKERFVPRHPLVGDGHGSS